MGYCVSGGIKVAVVAPDDVLRGLQWATDSTLRNQQTYTRTNSASYYSILLGRILLVLIAGIR